MLVSFVVENYSSLFIKGQELLFISVFYLYYEYTYSTLLRGI